VSDLENIYRRAEIYKLSIARASIEEAADAAKIVWDMKMGYDNPLYRPLHAAMVIAYGRAFSKMNPFGTISPKWRKFKDPSDQRAHDAIMRQRNTMVGHADHISERVMIYAKGDIMDNGEVAPRTQTVVLTNYIPPNDFVHILRMAGGLFARMSIAISDNMAELYGEGGANLKSSFELITEDDLKILKETRH
jgi:hypothetical protein